MASRHFQLDTITMLPGMPPFSLMLTLFSAAADADVFAADAP